MFPANFCRFHCLRFFRLQHHQFLMRNLCSKTQERKWPLPPDQPRPFKALNLKIRRKVDMKHVDLKELNQRLPTFSDQDWRLHLSVLGHPKDSFPRSQSQLMVKARDYATNWLLNNIDSKKTIDYYNYLCFLSHFCNIYQEQPPSFEDISGVVDSFVRRFRQLNVEEFFTVFTKLTEVIMEVQPNFKKPLLDESRLNEIYEYGTKLASDAHIHDMLGFLRAIDYFLKETKGKLHCYNSLQYADRLLSVMATKDTPADLTDLKSSLMFLADVNKAHERNILDHPTALLKRNLLRYPLDAQFHPAWTWLRYSIESVFEQQEYLRPFAALVAVRAFNCKAVDFSPDDVNRFLHSAAEPYLSYPERIFHREEGNDGDKPFIRLVYALLSATDGDLLERTKVTVKLDDVFWDRFFEMLKTWVPKHPAYFRTMLRMTRQLNGIEFRLTARQQLLFTRPFNQHRKGILHAVTDDANRLQTMLGKRRNPGERY